MGLTLRQEKGSFLTHQELDYNFIFLNIKHWEYGSYEQGMIVYVDTNQNTSLYVCVKTHSKNIYKNKQFTTTHNGITYWKSLSNTTIANNIKQGYIPVSDGTSLDSSQVLYYDFQTQNIGVNTTKPESQFQIEGSYASTIKTFYPTQNGDTYQMNNTDYTLIINTTYDNLKIELPDATNCIGRIYNLKKGTDDNNEITVQPIQSQLIDQKNNFKPEPFGMPNIKIQSDGFNWWII